MPRGVALTEFDKGLIIAHKENGKSNAEIARLIHKTRSCITKFLKRWNNPPSVRKPLGRPPKLSQRSMRRVLRSIRAKNRTCSQIIAQHMLQVSKSTLSRALHRAGCRWKRMKKLPAWKPHHIAGRLDFAREHMTWDKKWRRVIFSDEKKFNLDGPDGYKSYWHCLKSDFRSFSKRVGGGKSLMMWCGFAYGGKLELKIIRGRINAAAYCQMLEEVDLVENGGLIGGDDFIFQQDNAPIHSVTLFLILYLQIVNKSITCLGSTHKDMVSKPQYTMHELASTFSGLESGGKYLGITSSWCVQQWETVPKCRVA